MGICLLKNKYVEKLDQKDSCKKERKESDHLHVLLGI